MGGTMTSIRTAFLAAILSLFAAGEAPAQNFDLPFRAEDFDNDNSKVWWGRASHGGGIQTFGYDLGGLRYDASGKWLKYSVSEAEYNANPANDKFAIYGRPIYAMRDGKIIACWRNAPLNPKPGEYHSKIAEGYIYGGGNGYWIQHSDGTLAEYAHMIPGTVPSTLCPHNASLMPSKIPSPNVTDAWRHIRVAPANQATVKMGQFLGRVGNTGTSSEPHLHIHLEQGAILTDTSKLGGSAVPFKFKRGLAGPPVDGDPRPVWTSFSGSPIPPGSVVIWAPRSLGVEYTRTGVTAIDFQAWNDHLANSGFWPEIIDTFNESGNIYINSVWRPAKGPWLMHALRKAPDHQQATNDAVKAGFSPVYVESSAIGSEIWYSAIFRKTPPATVIMRHGLNQPDHEAVFNEAVRQKLSPVSVSVVSIDGRLYHTVLYRSESIGSSWVLTPGIPDVDFQAVYNEHAAVKRYPVYLNAFIHGGKRYISTIFSNAPHPLRKDKHGLNAAQWQEEFSSALKAGMLTRTLTAFDGTTDPPYFAASWWK